MFGQEFFDTGKREPGIFESYCFDDWYPKFRALATVIVKNYNPKRLLDVGCAKGFLVKALKDIGVEAWGVDVSEYAISKAPEDIRSNLVKVDLNESILPFEDKWFDFITCLGTIEHLDNHKHAIREMARVLEDAGNIYVTTVYQSDRKDKVRISVHSRDYWIKEFQSNEFKYAPEKLDRLIMERYEQIFAHISGNGLKFKVAKFLYQKVPYIGKKLVFLLHKVIERNYGILLFTKVRSS